ncbi:MAG: ABC transporter substrate-binding protein [Desulfovibrio sp.]|nr:ABC transporter substrate-binding protein [Desulfovibrio sp.]MBI4958104.1 ABC transporter substrate-binding protein [Desulfovibrio sp.]
MERFIWIGSALAVLAATLFLTFGSPAQPKPLFLGYVSSLSGKYSALAVAGRDGAVLAVEHLNARGGVSGRPVRLLILDDGFDAEMARQSVRQLAEQNACAVIGPFASTMARPMIAASRELDMLLVSPTASSDEFSGKDDLFIRMAPTTADCSVELGSYCAGPLKLKSLAALVDTTNEAYTASAVRNTKKGFLNAGGTNFSIIEYDARQAPSFMDLAKEALASNPDGIVLVSSPLDTAVMCQRLRLNNQAVPLFSSTWGMSVELVRSGGKAVEGVVSIESFDPGSRSPAYQEFSDAFSARFGRAPESSSMFNYEAVMVLARALKREPNARGGQLKNAILENNPHQGLQAEFFLDEFGDAKRPLFLLTVANGRLAVKD